MKKQNFAIERFATTDDAFFIYDKDNFKLIGICHILPDNTIIGSLSQSEIARRKVLKENETRVQFPIKEEE